MCVFRPIIGVIEGEFDFTPSMKSGRLYENVIFSKKAKQNIVDNLKDKYIFGVIGLDEKEITEKTIMEGKVATRHTNFRLENEKIVADNFILNTMAGKSLIEILKKSMKQNVSMSTGENIPALKLNKNIDMYPRYTVKVDKDNKPILNTFYLEMFSFIFK